MTVLQNILHTFLAAYWYIGINVPCWEWSQTNDFLVLPSNHWNGIDWSETHKGCKDHDWRPIMKASLSKTGSPCLSEGFPSGRAKPTQSCYSLKAKQRMVLEAWSRGQVIGLQGWGRTGSPRQKLPSGKPGLQCDSWAVIFLYWFPRTSCLSRQR